MKNSYFIVCKRNTRTPKMCVFDWRCACNLHVKSTPSARCERRRESAEKFAGLHRGKRYFNNLFFFYVNKTLNTWYFGSVFVVVFFFGFLAIYSVFLQWQILHVGSLNKNCNSLIWCFMRKWFCSWIVLVRA